MTSPAATERDASLYMFPPTTARNYWACYVAGVAGFGGTPIAALVWAVFNLCVAVGGLTPPPDGLHIAEAYTGRRQ